MPVLIHAISVRQSFDRKEGISGPHALGVHMYSIR